MINIHYLWGILHFFFSNFELWNPMCILHTTKPQPATLQGLSSHMWSVATTLSSSQPLGIYRKRCFVIQKKHYLFQAPAEQLQERNTFRGRLWQRKLICFPQEKVMFEVRPDRWKVCACVLSHFSHVQLLAGVSCHARLQGIFGT